MYNKCIFLLAFREIKHPQQMNQQDRQQKENKSPFPITIHQSDPGTRIFHSALVCID